MDNVDSILYQITNGKNGMPAFGGRIKENEMKEIANYVFSFPFDQKEN
jgi:cytochrome c6